MDSCINAYMGRMETRLDDLTYEIQQISSMVRITYPRSRDDFVPSISSGYLIAHINSCAHMVT